MKIELKNPIKFNNSEYRELDFAFEGLSGAHILSARAGMTSSSASYIDGLVPQLSMEFQARVAAEAAKVPYEVITLLPAAYFIKVTTEARSFLGVRD